MPTETTARRDLLKVLRRDLWLHAHAVESGDICPGFPDVEYCGQAVGQGTLELKYNPTWPKRPTTPLRVHAVRRAQVSFLKRRVRAGGTAGLLLKVGSSDWYLLNAAEVVRHYDRAKEQLVLPRELFGQLARFDLPGRGLSATEIERALQNLRDRVPAVARELDDLLRRRGETVDE